MDASTEYRASAKDPIPNRIAYPGNVWADPISGIVIPKDRETNLKRRRALLLDMENHPERIPTMLSMCRQSFELWCNLFVWTYKVQETTEGGQTIAVREDGAHEPFITWPVQDEAGAVFDQCMAAGEDQLWDKSREMGASWFILAKLHHKWLFYKNVEIREMSRKEEYVDSASAKSLFWKHDYINKHLPAWMRPSIRRKAMHLENTTMGSTISGESTNKDAMRGDRSPGGILIDEAASIDNLEAVLRATDRAGPRIFNSTPSGPGTFSQLRFSGKIRTIILPWWRHPERGAGASLRPDKSGQLKWTSPSYEDAKKHRTAREIAQNWDMDHAAAGAMFFDPGMLAEHRANYSQEPWFEGTIDFVQPDRYTGFDAAVRKGLGECFRFVDASGVPRHLKLWCDLVNGRPPANVRPVMGADISHGAGASQSALCVYDAITGVKLAELIDADLGPPMLADIAAMLGWWFGAGDGKGAALMVPEANGPGGDFLRRLQLLNYPHIYRHSPTGRTTPTSTQMLGWVSSRQEKENMLGAYAQAMMTGRIQNRSAYAVSQCEQYVYQKSGAVGAGTMESADGSARAVHADVVIADGLAVVGIQRAGRYTIKDHEPPPKSVAWHYRQMQKNKASDEHEW